MTHGLAAAAAGAQLPPVTEIERAWQQAVALTPDLANLTMMLKAIEHAAAPDLNRSLMQKTAVGPQISDTGLWSPASGSDTMCYRCPDRYKQHHTFWKPRGADA